MNFTVNSSVFLSAIAPSIEVSSKVFVKGLTNNERITINAKKDEVVLCSYNDSVSLRSPISDKNFNEIKYSCSEEGETTIQSNDLFNSLSSLPREMVNISVVDNELSVALVSDPDCFRNIATFNEKVVIPNIGDTPDLSITVDRESFLKSIERVSFAVSEEENRAQYQCVMVNPSGNRLQVVAGNGSLFAVDRMRWDAQSFSKKEERIFIPKKAIANIRKCLSEASCEMIELKHWPEKSNAPKQLTIDFDGMVMGIYHELEIFQTYPEVEKILKHDYPNSIYSNLKDWGYAVNGSLMTMRTHEDSIHNTEVKYDRKKTRLIVESKTKHKSKTTIPVPQVGSNSQPVDNIIGEGDLWFKCNTDFFSSMVSYSVPNKKDDIMISFESQELLESRPESDTKKKLQPILVSYPEYRDDVKNFSEEFYVFFTMSTKK